MRPILICCCFLTSCSGFNGARPERSISLDVPTTFKEASSSENRSISTGWVTTLQSPTITSLVNEALNHNHNLRASATRLENARENTIIGRAARLPDLRASGGASADYSEFLNTSSERLNLSLSASWEMDLWGRLKNLDRANYYDLEEAVGDFRGAQLSLAANTVQAWLNLISAEQQVDLAETTLSSFQKNLRIIERNFQAGTGDARDLDVAFGRNNVASAQRDVSSRKLSRDEAARSLELLLGRYPAAELKAEKDLPTLAKDIPSGIPSDLLSRRPDVLAAQSAVYASAERSEAARKNLLPSLRLTAGASNGSETTFSRIFDPNFIIYNAAATLSQTIYSGGELPARARIALNSNKAALENYAQTALVAFREVESALATERSLAEQEKFLITEVDKAAVAEKFAERAYIEGGNILSVLEAQRRVNGARATLIRLKNLRLQNRVDLYLALGGSY